MPGPRKNLTPLDMRTMGLTYNQGGILNFLGKQPEVTAPIRAQSHADSPPTQLAYITDAEKDLLVKSNIHGSMEGGPNLGPAGLESLDDWFITPSGGVGGGSGEAVSAWESAGMPDTGYSGPEGVYTPSTLPSGQAVAVNVVQTPEGPTISGPQTVVGVPGGSFLDEQVVPPPTVDEGPPPDDASSSFSLTDVLSNMNMGKYATTLGQGMFGWTNTPTIKKLQDPNYAAIMLKLMGGKNKRYWDYVDKWLWKDDETREGKETETELGKEVYEDFGAGSLEEYLKAQVDRGEEVYGEGWSEGEILKQIDPEAYYSDPDRVFPQTSGGLEDLARLDVASNPDIAQKIFDARQELDRQWGDQGGQGGGQGIASLPDQGLYKMPLPDPSDPTPDPDPTPDLSSIILGYPAGDMAYTAVMPREGYQYTYDAAGNRYEIPIGGAQSGETYGGRPFTWRPMETTPTPFDYSQWPQFGPAGGPVPNYVNQGLGQWPNFDYWNQIANAFPGMR